MHLFRAGAFVAKPEPLSGHLFLFCNGQRNRLKVLVWDGSGLWVCAKRLEKGRFTWPQSGDAQGKVILSHEELSLLLGVLIWLKPSTSGGTGKYRRMDTLPPELLERFERLW